MSVIFAFVFCAMSSADAIVTLLNTSSAVGPHRFAEAKEIVAKDARAGKTLQKYIYGLLAKDKDLSERYLNESRDKIRAMAETKNNPLAWYLLSMESNDLQLLQKAADGGNKQALNALGSIVVQEAVSDKQMDSAQRDGILLKGFRYFSQAAAMRDPNGLINLGTCYQRGHGCKQDMQLAFECFKTAAEMGHPEGMDYMSACFQFGHGVQADEERSLYWKMRGRCARGDAAAEKWLRDRK